MRINAAHAASAAAAQVYVDGKVHPASTARYTQMLHFCRRYSNSRQYFNIAPVPSAGCTGTTFQPTTPKERWPAHWLLNAFFTCMQPLSMSGVPNHMLYHPQCSPPHLQQQHTPVCATVRNVHYSGSGWNVSRRALQAQQSTLPPHYIRFRPQLAD